MKTHTVILTILGMVLIALAVMSVSYTFSDWQFWILGAVALATGMGIAQAWHDRPRKPAKE